LTITTDEKICQKLPPGRIKKQEEERGRLKVVFAIPTQ
jgi:hypothetical protein